MLIDLLTTSANDYALSQNKKLSDYILCGISSTEDSPWESKKKLASKGESYRCEVIVDVRYNSTPGRSETFFDCGVKARYTASGTGLMPK